MSSFDPGVLDAVRFPTPQHERVLGEAAARFAEDPRVLAMVLTNSLARDVADEASDLDYALFVSDANLLDFKAIARELRHAEPAFETHVAATTLTFEPRAIDLNDVDMFEIRVGNFLAHARPIFDRGPWAAARALYLPYYSEALARAREARFGELLRYQLGAGRLAVRRALAFEAAGRLLHAFDLFWAAAFVRARRYPVDYKKRIEAQARDLLGAPSIADQARAALAFDARDLGSFGRALDALEELAARHLALTSCVA